MHAESSHSSALEEVLLHAAECTFAANESTLADAAAALNNLMMVHIEDKGSLAQQLAVGTLLLDTGAVVDYEEGEDTKRPGDKPSEQIFVHHDSGFVLSCESIVATANAILSGTASVRNRIMAYMALRLCDQVPGEHMEMLVTSEARAMLRSPEAIDVLARVYSRRVLALVAEESDEVFDVFRAAQDEGHTMEAIRLADAGHRKLPSDKAMSLLALGVNVAEDLGSEATANMYGLLFHTLRRRFHALHHALPDNADLSANPEMRGLVAELEQLAGAFLRQEGCEILSQLSLAELAMQHALTGNYEAAVDALARLEAEGERQGGILEDVRPLMHVAQECIDRIRPEADEAEDDSDDNDDTRSADWWKNS